MSLGLFYEVEGELGEKDGLKEDGEETKIVVISSKID